jgi:glycosyltransferase involved in cell wall biosynthesis
MPGVNKYSIILPVRNGGNYVKDCVASILGQSLPQFNFHILENCSTDGTAEWLRSLKDERIILIEANKPLSIEENWKRIMDISKNEFITLIGHDDILQKDYLQTMDALISKHPDAGLYQTHFNFIDSRGEEIRKCLPMKDVMLPKEFLEAMLLNRISIMGTGFMMRSADYNRIGGLPDYPNLLFADFEMVLELARSSYFAVSSKECFSFRIHQSTTTSSADIKMQSGLERLIYYLKKLKEEDATLDKTITENANRFIHVYCKGLSHRLIRTPLDKRHGLTVTKLLQNCRQYALMLTGKEFDPLSDFSIRAAGIVDSNNMTRKMFLAFKKLFRKPILK